MIAADTSTVVAYLGGARGADIEAFEGALADRQVVLPPVVLTELMSARDLPRQVASLLRELPLLAIDEGYWERAGFLRAKVLAAGRRARLADVLIAQICLDHGVRLLTRDRDFRHFARFAGLRLGVR